MEDHETESSRVKELTVNLQTAVDLIQTQARDLAAAEVRLARAHQALFEAGDEPVAQIGRLDEIKEILSTVEKPIAVDTAGLWCPKCEAIVYTSWNGGCCNEIQDGVECEGKLVQPVTVVVMAGGHETRKGE